MKAHPPVSRRPVGRVSATPGGGPETSRKSGTATTAAGEKSAQNQAQRVAHHGCAPLDARATVASQSTNPTPGSHPGTRHPASLLPGVAPRVRDDVDVTEPAECLGDVLGDHLARTDLAR